MTQIVGHRGGRNLWPENSIAGFRNLLDLPVEVVEFDVHLSDAGELLVIHDATLDRTTDASGPVRALAPENRNSVRLQGSAEGIPTLAEVLEVFAASSIDLHVELKSDGNGTPYAGMPERVLSEIDRFDLRSRSVLTSFDLDVLRRCRSLAPDIRRLCSMTEQSAARLGFDATFAEAREVADYVALHKELCATRWVQVQRDLPLHRLGVWVTNTSDEIIRWLGENPGFITTDDPVLATRIRDDITTVDHASTGVHV